MAQARRPWFPVLLALSLSLPAGAAEGNAWLEPSFEMQLAGPEVVNHDAMLDILTASSATWMNVEGAPELHVSSEPGQADAVAFDGVNAVFFQKEWTGHPSQLALTFTHVSDGEILEMDMAINAEHHLFTTNPDTDWNAFDLENLITHELGHGLGLDHLAGETASMFHRIDPGETHKRDLEPQDVETFEALYQARTSAGGCAATGGPPLFLGVLLLFLSALRIRPARSAHEVRS
jgi:uncharacterized protein (TIGR03382 family)